MSLTVKTNARARKVLLPVVTRLIQQLDAAFVDLVGPVGQELATDTFHLWLLAGKTGPSGLRVYAHSLGAQLDADQHALFSERAEALLGQLHAGLIT